MNTSAAFNGSIAQAKKAQQQSANVPAKIAKPAHKLKARVSQAIMDKKAAPAISYKREELLALRNCAASKHAIPNIPKEILAMNN